MGKLRLGVIGAGSWTVSSHLPSMERRRDEVDFVIVNRRNPDLLATIRDKFGFQKASPDYRDVIAEHCDIVIVASPVGRHYEHAKAALEGGAHVLCEKPFTINPAEAWDLVEIAKRNDRHLVLAYGWNYKPMVVKAKELMEQDGGIGDLEQMTIHMASVTRELLSETGAYPASAPEAVPEAETWADPALSGGGYGQAQLTHALGAALWLTGARGKEAFALMSAPLGARVELHDAIAVRYENGAIGTLGGGSCHLGSGNNKHQVEIRAIGSRGQFHVDLEREIVWRYRSPEDDVRLPLEEDAGLYDCIGPVDALVDLPRGRGTNNSPGELGARTVEILDAAYRSSRSGALEPIQPA